jgi:hypothetical protein
MTARHHLKVESTSYRIAHSTISIILFARLGIRLLKEYFKNKKK